MNKKTNSIFIFPLYLIDKQTFIINFPNKRFLYAYFSNGGSLKDRITAFTIIPLQE